jgi:hypothetical protein
MCIRTFLRCIERERDIESGVFDCQRKLDTGHSCRSDIGSCVLETRTALILCNNHEALCQSRRHVATIVVE